jgi:hypothetical protein
MPRDYFDSPRKAVDKTSATVLYAKGVHFTSKKKITERHWEVQPPVVPFRGWSYHDLTGKRFGRFLVIGVFDGAKNYRKKTLWVVKCACGRYETRSRRALLNPKNKGDRCNICKELAYQKREDDFRQYGKYTKEAYEY